MQDLLQQLEHSFRDPSLLEGALIHRSYRHEKDDIHRDNQRLEFLGDAALGLVAADRLYHRFPLEQEGSLTRMRSLITNRSALAIVARRLGLSSFIRLGRGEQLSGGYDRESNLGDAMEAILGALYLDGGLEAVHRVYDRFFAPLLDELMESDPLPNPKGSLLEWTQERWKSTPVYRVVEASGPDHDRRFTVEAVVAGEVKGLGTGRTKRLAEARAAEQALSHLMRTD
jgi:ribonuclease-3